MSTENDQVPPEQQLAEVKAVWKSKLKADERWAVVDATWFKSWCDYTGFSPNGDDATEATGSNPGPIDNSKLQEGDNDFELRKGLAEGEDYALVIEEVWDLLHSWYGGGPRFVRTTELFGFRGEARVTFYPTFLTFVLLNDEGEPDYKTKEVREFAKGDTFETAISYFETKLAREADEKDSDFVRFWIEKKDEDEEGEVSSTEGVVAGEGAAGEVAAGDAGADDHDDEKKKKAKKWVIVRGDLAKGALESYQFPSGMEVWVDCKVEGEWKRSAVKKNFRDFEVGDHVDAQDTVDKWYESEVVEVNEEKQQVLIHFIGWNAKWDIWFPFDSERICAQNTHTVGPYKPGKKVPSYTSGYRSYSSHSEGTPEQRGAVGLRNLGNTCFMNSTLQCLSHTPILTEYFVEKQHISEINRDNPLGWKGRIADEYASLMLKMWSNKYTVVSPTDFKSVIGQFAPRFSGYAQHDSSELLSFLLDGLHEDLNRVLDKPVTQTVESNGREDAVVAKEAWDTYLMRNQSKIVDTVMGQLKSKLVCPDCDRVSITFDPFMFLSVPLPQKVDKTQKITFVFNDPSKKLLQCTPMVPKVAHIIELKKAISAIVGVSPQRMVVADVWRCKVHNVLPDHDTVSRIRSSDTIFVYEIPEVETLGSHKPRFISVNNISAEDSALGAFGLPLIVALDGSKEINVQEIYRQVTERARPWIKGGVEKPYKAVLVDSPYASCLLCDDRSCKGCELTDEDRVIQIKMTMRSNPIVNLLWEGAADTYDEDRITPEIANGGTEQRKGSMDGSAPDAIDLMDCFNAFTKKEVLGEQDPWYCSQCKKHQQATKKFDLYKLPDVLIVHLKRFSYSQMSRDKIGSLVDFPIEDLDLSGFCVSDEEKDNSKYDLYAVSNHMGGLGGGHYTAYCKNLLSGKWYCHDDSRVTPVSVDRIVSPSAYVLFYKRRGLLEEE